MRNILIRMTALLLGFAVGTGASRMVMHSPLNEGDEKTQPHNFAVLGPATANHQPEPVELHDAFSSYEHLTYNGYVISRAHKRVKEEFYRESTVWFDVSYVLITRNNRTVAQFDPGYHFGMGGRNMTRFGMFPFLGGSMKQLVVSQEVNRGGTQMVARLYPSFQVIFDGSAWGVGREGDDMDVIDLDNDGVYEIAVPLTDFYDFQDKMSISAIPLPTIIFKYDQHAEKYLPANALFADYSLRDVSKHSRGVESNDELFAKSRVLHVLLDNVYAGRQEEGWSFFESRYRFSDKEEFRQRVRWVLKDQPVYKFIYNQR
jgi:hypothetical protein